jgi:hypothetical protein
MEETAAYMSQKLRSGIVSQQSAIEAFQLKTAQHLLVKEFRKVNFVRILPSYNHHREKDSKKMSQKDDVFDVMSLGAVEKSQEIRMTN